MRRRFFLASSADPDHTTRPRCRMYAGSCRARPGEAGDGVNERGLAGTVRAHDRDHLARVHFKRHPGERADAAVAHGNVAYLEDQRRDPVRAGRRHRRHDLPAARHQHGGLVGRPGGSRPASDRQARDRKARDRKARDGQAGEACLEGQWGRQATIQGGHTCERLALAQAGQDQEGLLSGFSFRRSEPVEIRWRRMMPAAKFRV
jgi:hypothetical protein